MSTLKNFSKSCRYRQRKRASIQAAALLMSSSDDDYDNIPNQTPLSQQGHSSSVENLELPDNIHNTFTEECLQNTDNSLSSNTSSDHEDTPNLRLIVAQWALRCNVPHNTLNDLLHSISIFPEFQKLPKDARTLLNTPTMISIKQIKGGIYHHFSIKNELEYLMKNIENLPSVLNLMIGIDGLPITNNPVGQLWPILGYFSNIGNKKQVFIIGAFYGKSKPSDCNEFLNDFVNEIKDISIHGFSFNKKYVRITLQGLICDAPAKSFVLNIRGHNCKHSCLRCLNVGRWLNHRVFFPELESPLRTHENFISYTDQDFHTGVTILSEIPDFNIVLSTPFDYMHTICIGLMKKLLLFWTGFHKHYRSLPSNLISALEDKLTSLSSYIPEEFQRKPDTNCRRHPLRDSNRWKATELRECLLYTGIVIFQDILSKEVYEHFLELSIAIRILLASNTDEVYLTYAKKLLKHFVGTFPCIYGEIYMSHNVHSVLHLVDDVKQYGSLNNCSAFPFESFMQPIKKKIRSGMKPLQQLACRFAEMRANNVNTQQNSIIKISGPLNARCTLKERSLTANVCMPQYTGWRINGFSIKINSADNCVKMKDGSLVVLENIATSKTDENNIVVIGRRYQQIKELFKTPCSSQLLDIHVVCQLDYVQTWPLEDVVHKLVRLPLCNNRDVLIPFAHDT